MIIHRSMHAGYLSNGYLLADRKGGHAVLVDTGGPTEPIVAKIEELGVELTHILCTHHHVDHVSGNDYFRRRYRCPVWGHRLEARLFGDLDEEFVDGQEFESGALRIRALHVPGHTVGQTGFVAGETCVFTGDTLFRESVGGTLAPGHAGLAELRRSIMEVLMRLPQGMIVYPGHAEATTIGHEWEHNAFIRAWRGVDRPRAHPCVALGRQATLLLRAADYDGGTKCWVRFEEDGSEEIVPGSRVSS